MDGDYPIYESRGEPQDIRDLSGIAFLTDFGSARTLDRNKPHTDWAMTDTYRAPEVLMGVQWGPQVDVWSIGILVCYKVQHVWYLVLSDFCTGARIS